MEAYFINTSLSLSPSRKRLGSPSDTRVPSLELTRQVVALLNLTLKYSVLERGLLNT